MKVFVESNHDLPLVGFTIALRVGSSSDPLHKDGLARVTARMLRRGAGALSALQIEEALDSLGGEMSVHVGVNGITIACEVIARNLEPFVNHVAMILGEPTFDEAELVRLLRESEGELIEARDNDQELARRAFYRIAFDGHPYARRAAGSIATLSTLQRGDIIAFYKQHFCRANASVAICGDCTFESAQAIAERLLGSWPEGILSADPVSDPEMKRGRRLIFVDKPERTQTQMCIGGLGTQPWDEDHTALQVANTIFGGTFTARLMREVRSKRGWSYGAYARLPLERHREAFSMWTAPGAHDAAACLELELELLSKWRSKGVTLQELRFAKSYLIRSRVFDIDTPQKRVHQKIESATLDLPEGYHENYIPRVKGVTKEHADAAVQHRISEEDLTIAVVGTHKAIGSAIEKAISNLSDMTVVPFDWE